MLAHTFCSSRQVAVVVLVMNEWIPASSVRSQEKRYCVPSTAIEDKTDIFRDNVKNLSSRFMVQSYIAIGWCGGHARRIRRWVDGMGGSVRDGYGGQRS